MYKYELLFAECLTSYYKLLLGKNLTSVIKLMHLYFLCNILESLTTERSLGFWRVFTVHIYMVVVRKRYASLPWSARLS